MKRRILIILAGAVLLTAAGYGGYRSLFGNASQPAWKFAKIERGPLTASVSATGTLNPVVAVQVGSQVSGQLKEIMVDFNAQVKAGQLIARIDPETFQQKVRQAEADLDAANAAVSVQRAQQLQAQVSLQDAQRDFERKKLLVEKNFISPAERDKAQTALAAANAQVQVTEAQSKNSEALVRQRAAQLAQSRVDLERTAIRSPVDGIVVKRSVSTGQTVAASLQAPELFIIAQNLTDMQVETSIDEADVGRIRVGQKASFTVDAFPGRNFEGEVMQVRKAALVVSNVVTYTVIVSAANPDLILLPGMTANVRIVSAQKDAVLKVANAALRFKPPQTGDAAEGAKENAREGKAADTGAQPRAGKSGKGAGRGGKLWVLGEDGKPKAINVKTGITDGTATEIISDESNALQEGTQVLTGTAGTGAGGAAKSAAPGPRSPRSPRHAAHPRYWPRQGIPHGQYHCPCPARRFARHRGRRVCRRDGAVGFGQIHLHEPAGLPRPPERR